VELIEAMRTMNACRYYRPDPVPDEVFYRAVEAARFAPQGGNRQPVRFLVVRDPEKKRTLGEWYLQRWEEIVSAVESGERTLRSPGGVARPTWLGFSDPAKVMRDTDQFARHFGEHPAIVVVCADLAAVHPTDADLGRLSIVGGASVYPMVQNFCLALRDQGVATTLTTLLVAQEERVKELLGIPDAFSTACHVVAGYPARGFPRTLNRRPVEELAFAETFGAPLTADPVSLSRNGPEGS
jgi:nitroreductase